jgi:hypothetical protein
VTGFALKAESTEVYIFIVMAPVTSDRQGIGVFHRQRMTRNTADDRVLFLQHKAGFKGVVKACAAPACSIMTSVAAGTQSLSVDIVGFVTRIALLWCFPELWCVVTSRAGSNLMLSSQWKPRCSMIK